MNEKEILDNIKNKYEDYYVQDIVSGNDLKQLLDYITNLQQEKEDYKSHCEKAIEYIDKQKKKMYKSRNKIALFILLKLENILQNGSEEK